MRKLRNGTALWLLALGGATGCASSPPTPRGAEPALAEDGSLRVTADWADVEPSVKVALGQVGIASLRVDRSDPARRTYSLLTPRDEPGTLTIERLAPADQPDPVPISISCTIGRFGDPAREAELVTRVAERLGQLRGVEVAPIRR